MGRAVVKSGLSFPEDGKPNELHITRDQITRMMLESHKKAANSAEEIGALKEVAKLNDLYPSTNSSITLNLTHVEHSLSQLQGLSDAELIKLSGAAEDMFALPEPIIGEFEEIEEGKGEEGQTGSDQGIKMEFKETD